jgi:hypothetical protein
MQNNKIKKLIKAAVLDLLNNTTSEKKISQIVAKHAAKVHFVPTRYRIFGGLLQSLNIQFGNFIEVLMHKIVEGEGGLEIIKVISGKKNIPLSLTEKTDALIDKFITERQNNADKKLDERFQRLLEDIIKSQQESDNLITTKHDVDVLFRDKKSGVLYYVETKYNDDHDTGKFVDINRKFLKTFAGLVKTLKIKDTKLLKPILYYLTKKIMKGNIYVPEGKHIYRGDKLFKEFFTLRYGELDDYLKNISEDKEILEIFDNLYKKIRFGK